MLLPNGWREAASFQQVTPAVMASDRAVSVALSASRGAAVPAWPPMRSTIKTLFTVGSRLSTLTDAHRSAVSIA
jgi:hypothetical protein